MQNESGSKTNTKHPPLTLVPGKSYDTIEADGVVVFTVNTAHPDAFEIVQTTLAAPKLLAACRDARAALARIARGLSEEDGSALVASATFAFISDVLTPAIELAEGKQS